MHDAFALLHLPRRPWLEEAEIRSAFQRRAALAHPDAGSGSDGDFAKLTKAYHTLREPSLRLRHLLELSAPSLLVVRGVPEELVALFPVVARVREQIARFNRGMAADPDPTRDAESAREQIAKAMNEALDEVRAADSEWPSEASVQRLGALQTRLVFLEKWQAQLREALLQLELG